MELNKTLFTSIVETRARIQHLERPLALIPTMGALHAGHISLIEHARRECKSVAVSIFVNPTQFTNPEDLKRYPRNLERDCELLQAAGVDLIYAPDSSEMYEESAQTFIYNNQLANYLEGRDRPGHFQGVCTVVAMLFNITGCDKAVFGEKDFQQLRIVEQMVRDFKFPVKILRAPTKRESNNLAISSRNERLSPIARQKAQIIFEAMIAAKTKLTESTNTEDLVHAAISKLETVPEIKIFYIQIVNEETLLPVVNVTSRSRILVAVEYEGVRLIDNLALY